MGAFSRGRPLFREYVRDALRRGDRYAETSIRRAFNAVWLADDHPDEALADLDDTRWTPGAGFHLQHWYELEARAEIGLYTDRARPVLDEIQPQLEQLRRSKLLRVQFLRNLYNSVLGRLALARHDLGDSERARVVLAAARHLERERIGYAGVWARLLRAGVARERGDDDEARRLLAAAAAAAAATDLLLHAAVARRRLGEVVGGTEGAELIAGADAWMTVEGIRNPARMAVVIAPMKS
jgi:hypothetical protein